MPEECEQCKEKDRIFIELEELYDEAKERIADLEQRLDDAKMWAEKASDILDNIG